MSNIQSECASPGLKKYIVHTIDTMSSKESTIKGPGRKTSIKDIIEESKHPDIYENDTPYDLHEMLKDESEDEEEQLNFELDEHLTESIK